MESSQAVAQAKYWHLRQVAVFADLAASEVRELAEHFDMRLVRAGQPVYEFGDAADRVYVLRAGRIKVTRASSDGKEFILNLVSPGEIFGELAVAGKGLRSATAMVIEDAFVCAIDKERFKRSMLRNPALALAVSRVIGGRKERTEERVLDLISKDVRTRLADALTDLVATYGVADGPGMRIDLRLTQTDLAQLVGSTRETTSTVFNEFRRGNLVDSEGKTVWILDPEGLDGYAPAARVKRPHKAA